MRLGGIYTLQRIMQDSPGDQATVVAVLCAFIRDHANDTRSPHAGDGIPADIQAALTGVATRDTVHDGSSTVVDLVSANLAGADLTGADLVGANLTGANLAHAYLVGANLTRADLCDADLSFTDLTNVNLTNAKVARLNLKDATLTNANFTQVVGFPIQNSMAFSR